MKDIGFGSFLNMYGKYDQNIVVIDSHNVILYQGLAKDFEISDIDLSCYIVNRFYMNVETSEFVIVTKKDKLHIAKLVLEVINSFLMMIICFVIMEYIIINVISVL